MSSGREDLCSLEKSKSVDDTPENHKESELSYTRDFLLSLAEMDACKRLPNGFDSLVFCEGIGLGGLSQSRRSPDFGILSSNQGQPSWKNPGPGLLGSFSLQRVYECPAGTSAPQIQEKGHHLLKRSTAPYCPPHFSKANLQSKRLSNDLYNDETFGSSKYLSPERAEDETWRRDSFELMRKEHQKAIKENQSSAWQKENSDPDIANKCNMSDKSKPPLAVNKASIWHSSSSKPSSAAQQATTRFERMSLVEESATKSLAASTLPEVKDNLIRSSILSSSNFSHQNLKEVVKTADSMSTGQMKCDSEKHEACHDEAYNTSFSYGRDELLSELLPFTLHSEDEISNKLYTFNESIVSPVLNYNDVDQPIFSDGDEHYSTHRQCNQGRSTCDMEDNQPNSSSVHGISQLLNSVLDKGIVLSDSETSSILSAGSPDGVYLYEAGDSGKQSNTLDTEILKNMLAQYGTMGEGLSQELSTEVETSREIYKGRMTKSDALEPFGCLHSFNNDAISSTADGSIGINHVTACELPICSKKSGLIMSEGDQCTDNDMPMEVVYPANTSEGKANSFDDVCLPDEDSLITVDDWIFPENSISMPDGISTRADLFASNTPIDVSQKLTASAVYCSDERYTRPNIDGPTSGFSMYDRVGLENYLNLQPRLSHSLPFHSHTSQDKEFFHHSKCQKAHLSSVVGPLGFRADPYEPPPYRCSSTNVLPYPFQCPHVEPTWFDHRGMHSLMPIPHNYPPPNQASGGMSNCPLPHQLVNQMPHYAEELHEMQRGHPMNFQHPIYQGFEMKNLGHIYGIGGNQAALGGLYDTGVRGEQRMPEIGGKGIFGNHVNLKR